MAISEVTGRVPPAAALRQMIAERRKSTMVLAAGLGPLLEVLDAYVAVTEARLTALEAGK